MNLTSARRRQCKSTKATPHFSAKFVAHRCRWIWDPKGSKAYVFDKVDAAWLHSEGSDWLHGFMVALARLMPDYAEEKHGFFWRPVEVGFSVGLWDSHFMVQAAPSNPQGVLVLDFRVPASEDAIRCQDFWIFLAASGITLVIGLAAGVVAAASSASSGQMLHLSAFVILQALTKSVRTVLEFSTRCEPWRATLLESMFET